MSSDIETLQKYNHQCWMTFTYFKSKNSECRMTFRDYKIVMSKCCDTQTLQNTEYHDNINTTLIYYSIYPISQNRFI